jgi:hypothetical protein
MMQDAESRSAPRPSPLVVGIVMTLLVFLLPFGYGLDLGPGPDYVRALTWEYIDAPWFAGFRIVSLGTFFESLLYTFPRFLFLYQMIRHYVGKTSRKSVIWTGIASELFPLLVSAVRVGGWLLGWTQPPPPLSDHWFPIYLPIPLLMICGMGLVFVLPPRAVRDARGIGAERQ